jgi:hypothetical protein
VNRYRYGTVPAFWASYRRLDSDQQAAAKRTFKIFIRDAFDPRLRTHKIHSLSARAKRAIYAVEIAADLRALFFIRGDEIISFDIGTHDVYRR